MTDHARVIAVAAALSLWTFVGGALANRFGVRGAAKFALRLGACWLVATTALVLGDLAPARDAIGIGFTAACTVMAIAMLPIPIVSVASLPAIAVGYLELAVGWSSEAVARNVTACLVVAAIGVACRLKSYLTRDGAFAAWLVGYGSWGLGGARWFVPMISIFLAVNWGDKLVGALLGRTPPKRADRIEEKGSERDHVQVFANSGLGLVLVVVAAAASACGADVPWLFGAYIGSLAAACADTLASEIGIMSRARPILLWTLRPVPAGQSGGVTAFGYLGAAIGSLVPAAALAAISDAPNLTRLFVGALACGLAGSTVDSIVGATLQAKRKCAACGLVVERAEHCDVATLPESGLSFVTNDAVNVIGALVGAIVGAFVLQGIG